VAEKTPSRSKPDRGVIRFFFQVLKEDQSVIQSGFKTIMIRRKQARPRKNGGGTEDGR
jgi:hypothetical protein